MVKFIAELGGNAAPFTKPHLLRMLTAARFAGADMVKVQLFSADHFPEEEREAKLVLEFPRVKLAWFFRMAGLYGLVPGASVFSEDDAHDAACTGAAFLKLATREEMNAWLRYRVNCIAQTHHMPVFRSARWPKPYPPLPVYYHEVTFGCIPEYPTTRANWCLVNALEGWSSHTTGWDDVLAAVRGGATIIEKHLDLDGTGPEAAWSLTPEEFREMVLAARAIDRK